jgi:hypothetical protein
MDNPTNGPMVVEGLTIEELKATRRGQSSERQQTLRFKMEMEFVVPISHLPQAEDLERQVVTRLDIAMTEGVFIASNFLKRHGMDGVMIMKDGVRRVG